MSTVNLSPSGDTMILDTAPTTNYSTNALLYVGKYVDGSQTGRSLIKFDLSSLSGTTINSATLKLYDNGNDFSDNARTAQIYRILRNMDPSTATWNTYDGSNSWGTAGCGNNSTDYNSTTLGTISMTQPESAGTLYSTSITTSVIQSMVDGGTNNYGFLILADVESNDMHALASQENGTSGYRPILTIDYTEATTTSTTSSSSSTSSTSSSSSTSTSSTSSSTSSTSHSTSSTSSSSSTSHSTSSSSSSSSTSSTSTSVTGTTTSSSSSSTSSTSSSSSISTSSSSSSSTSSTSSSSSTSTSTIMYKPVINYLIDQRRFDVVPQQQKLP